MDLLFLPTRAMNGHDRNSVKEKKMSTNTIDDEKGNDAGTRVPEPKGRLATAQKTSSVSNRRRESPAGTSSDLSRAPTNIKES